jgi:ferredoxin
VKLVLDTDACMGYANCVIEAPELFDIDEDSDKAVILEDNPDDSFRAAAERAVRVCPAVALRIEDEG